MTDFPSAIAKKVLRILFSSGLLEISIRITECFMSYNKLIHSCWEVNGSPFPTILDCLFDISFCGEDVSSTGAHGKGTISGGRNVP